MNNADELAAVTLSVFNTVMMPLTFEVIIVPVVSSKLVC